MLSKQTFISVSFFSTKFSTWFSSFYSHIFFFLSHLDWKQGDKPTITNINVIWRPRSIILTLNQPTIICPKLIIETLKQAVKRHWLQSGVFIVTLNTFHNFSRVSIVNFEQVNAGWVHDDFPTSRVLISRIIWIWVWVPYKFHRITAQFGHAI